MAADYKLQIYTQEKKVLEDRVVSIVAPGQFGSFGVLAHHAPLVALLGRGKLTVRHASGDEDVFEVDGGFLEVCNNIVTLLVDHLLPPPPKG